jgi:hypothetical protein
MNTVSESRATSQKTITFDHLRRFDPSVEQLGIDHLRLKHGREANLLDHLSLVLAKPMRFVDLMLKVSRRLVRWVMPCGKLTSRSEVCRKPWGPSTPSMSSSPPRFRKVIMVSIERS